MKRVTDRTMMLYHVTPTWNFDSIRTLGLSRKFSKDVMRSIWLVSQSRLDWAKEHVMNRHNTTEVWVLNVFVRRRKLVRSKRGVWRSIADIPTSHLDYVVPGRVRIQRAYGQYTHIGMYYGECPVCKTNEYSDCWGDEAVSGVSVSFFECAKCGGTFSVYDNHADYTYAIRKDHADWYYSFDWECLR